MDSLLIVEDDIAYSTMMQTWLKKKGFDVDKVSSVKAAVKIINSDKQYHLVLSDLRLPDHDGLFLLDWMRKSGINIPFIVMTSYAEVQNAVLAMKSGTNDYIAKPVQPDILLQKIHDACCRLTKYLFKNMHQTVFFCGSSYISSDTAHYVFSV